MSNNTFDHLDSDELLEAYHQTLDETLLEAYLKREQS